jgi:phosphonate transport system substrate-binding protein
MKYSNFFVSLCFALTVSAAHAANTWTLAVSEGTSGGIDAAEALAKYEPLARLIEKATGHKVVVVLAREFHRLEASMKSGAYDLVMARPSDFPARGVRDYGYRLISTMNPDGACYIIVKKDSPLKKVQDLKGKKLLFPEKVAYMSKFCRADLRDHGIILEAEKVTYMREQDAVAWAMQNGLADAGGLASYSKPGKNWEKDGGRLLHQSIPQPYFPLIASKNVPSEDITKIQDALKQAEQTADGAKLLALMGVKGFNIGGEKRLLDLLKWLEK